MHYRSYLLESNVYAPYAVYNYIHTNYLPCMERERREYLSLIGLTVLGALAGCSDESGADEEAELTDNEEEGDDEPTEEADDTEGDEEEEVEEQEQEDDAATDSEYVDEIEEQVVLEYGETAHVSNGIRVTAHGLSIYDQMGDNQPEERDAFAVLQISTENTSDEQRQLPAATGGWELFYGDQQIDQTFNVSALDAEDYSQLEGGDVQGGVTREGVILFEVDEGFSPEDIDTLWFDNFQFVEETGQTIDVRWTTNL